MTGKNKKMYYPIRKTIRMNKFQSENWEPKNIRSFLACDREEQHRLLRLHYERLLGKTDNQEKYVPFNVYHKLEFDYNQLLKNYEKYCIEEK